MARSTALAVGGLAALLWLAPLIPPAEATTSVTLSSATADGFVSACPSATCGADERVINFGNDTIIYIKSGDVGRQRRILVKFDLSTIPMDAAVKVANLELFMSTAPTVSQTFQAYRITNSWVETGATWLTRDGTTAWTTAGGDFTGTAVTTTSGTTANVWKTWNIKTEVQNWVNGTNPNHGSLLKNQTETGTVRTAGFNARTNASNNPKLTVTYLLKARDLTATAGNTQVILNWVLPGGNPDYTGTLIIGGTDSATVNSWAPTDNTSYTAGTSTCGAVTFAACGVVFNNTALATTFTHTGRANGTTYYYKAFTRDSTGCVGACYSLKSAVVSSMPTSTVSPNPKWGYSTSATSLAAPGIDPNNVVIAGSNDNKLHGQNSSDGVRAFVPFSTGGAIQARPAVIPDDYSVYNRAGTVGYWKFDDASGTIAADSSGNGNTGTLVNSPTWDPSGKIRGALSFNGTNNYVSVANSSALQFNTGTSITISAWVKPVALPAYGQIVVKGRTTGAETPNYGLEQGNFVGGNKKLGFYYRNSANTAWHTYATTADVFTIGSWAHVTATYTFGTGSSVKLYVNGVQQSGSWTGGTGNDAPTVTTEPLWIGAIDQAGGGAVDSPFNGLIDDVRIYNRALSAAEVLDVYKGLNIAYITAQDGFVYAINTGTGAQVWKSPSLAGANELMAGTGVWLQAFGALPICGANTDAVFVGTLIGGSDLNKVYALNGSNTTVTTTGGGNCTSTSVLPGGILWTFTGGPTGSATAMRTIKSTPYVDYVNNVLWVTSHATGLTTPSVWKFNVSDGTLAAGTSTWNLDDIDGDPTPSFYTTFMYVGTFLGTLTAIRVSDGAVFTHTPVSTAPCNCTGAGAIKGSPWPLSFDPVTVATPDTIIFSRNATVHSVNFNGSTFSANWTMTPTGAPATVSAPVDDGAGNIYVGASDGKVHRIAISNGADQAQVTITGSPTPIVGDPTFDVALNRIYVGASDGHIYAFSAGF